MPNSPEQRDADGPEVRLVAGHGLVARRDRAVLFLPDADGAVAATFVAAIAGNELAAVTAAADAADADLRFVAIDWSDRVRLVVCGDVEVSTDFSTLPRLSARGAGTWVERTLSAPVTLSVGAEADDLTRLGDGLVRAGGFELRLPVSDVPHEETVDERPAPSEPSPPIVDVVEPTAAVDRLASEVLGTPPTDRFAAGPDDVTIVPDLLPPPSAPAPAADSADARWRLDFADGDSEVVDRTVVLGRSPSRRDGETEDSTRLVRVECRQVSSRHLAVRPEADGVTLVDLGSSNGSFVLTTGDGRLVRLEPGVPHPVDAGAIVQIGTRRFTVRRAG
ncbi:MAG: FHA domain-containing protein [Ilumatobacter sp.]|nr:FHA domain-containing protein [Ilumatobacter sp.]